MPIGSSRIDASGMLHLGYMSTYIYGLGINEINDSNDKRDKPAKLVLLFCTCTTHEAVQYYLKVDLD